MSKGSVSMATPEKVHAITVLEVICGRGGGVEGDPCRTVLQYWSPDGRLLPEHDPETDEDEASKA